MSYSFVNFADNLDPNINLGKPQHIFYVDFDVDSISIDHGNTKSQTSYSRLYKEYTLQNRIGHNSTISTIFDTNNGCISEYESSVSTVYRLPIGNIGISHAPKLIRYENGCHDYYELPRSHSEIAPIVFGTGAFINKTGYVVIISEETGNTKQILVYY